MRDIDLKDIAVQVMIAACYIVLTISLQAISYGSIQFRVAEGLLVLVFFNKKHMIGLLIGTFIANLFGAFGIIDATFGTLASLIALTLMILVGKNTTLKIISLIFPVIVNAVIVGILICYLEDIWSEFWIVALGVGIGQLAVLYSIGVILYFAIDKNEYLKELLS